MACIIWGSFAFVLFFLYDFLQMIGPRRAIFSVYVAGGVMLALSTVGLLITTEPTLSFWSGFWVLLAMFCLILLVYTLFVALPFGETFVRRCGEPQLICKGVYALCRHPGVLWFSACYFCLWLAWPDHRLLAAWIIFTLWNTLYAWMQDQWVFPAQFPEYPRYRQTTPFLFPTRQSAAQCFRTLFLQQAGGSSDEI